MAFGGLQQYVCKISWRCKGLIYDSGILRFAVLGILIGKETAYVISAVMITG